MRAFARTALALATHLAAVLATACATNPVTGGKDFVLMSEADEIRLGREYQAKVFETYDRYPDPALQAYVQEIGDAVAARSHRSQLIYRFTVLDSNEVNAFALPGGYIFITRGLLAYLNSEAELAAVLGHEIGHVTARHSVRQHSARTAAQVGQLGLVLIASVFMPQAAAAAANNATGLLGGALLSGYGREHELESDRLGAEYLARAGYSPQAMLDVIGVLKNQETFAKERAKEEGREPHSYHGLFATHPENDTRLQEVIKSAGALKVAHGLRPANRDGYLKRLDGLTFGPSAKQGVVRGREFYHDELGIALRFPQGWRIDNESKRLLATSRDNSAMLQMTLEDLNKRLTPEEFLRQRLRVEPRYGAAQLSAGALPGYTAVAASNTSLGRRDVRYAVIFLRQQAYIFAGLTKQAGSLPQHDQAFVETARSLHAMTDEERELAAELEIEIVQVGDGVTYSSLSRESRIPNYPEAQLRLLNGNYPQGEPVPGSLIKLVK